ncbi:MAG: hypothetical protein ABI587_12185 [Gemmatimonadales bacterium]
MRFCFPMVLLPCLALAPHHLRAQATADQAQLEFTIGLGQTSGGGRLWRVGKQPFAVNTTNIDTLSINRSFRRTINVSFSGTYFPTDHLGFVGEAQMLGLGTEDGCDIQYTEGDTQTAALCKSIGRAERSATSVAVSAGAVYRIASHQVVHPYIRVGGGVVVTEESFVRMHGDVGGSGDPVDQVLFADDNNSTVQPFALFGGGVVAVIGKGMQFRFEVRDNWVRVPTVTGPTIQQGLIPPTGVESKHILSFMIGFDIVLERKRGRRY